MDLRCDKSKTFKIGFNSVYDDAKPSDSSFLLPSPVEKTIRTNPQLFPSLPVKMQFRTPRIC